MYDKDSKGISWTAGFFMLIAFTFAAIIIGDMITRPVWSAMTGLDASKMLEASADPANRNAMRVAQCISALVGFLLPSLVTAYVLNRKPIKLLGLSQKINGQQIGLVCVIMFAALFVSGFLGYVNHELPLSASLKEKFDKMEADNIRQTIAILGLENTGDYLISIVIMAFLPALCEEALFRGGLQNYLTRSTRKPWLSIIIVSVLFSAMHLSYYGFLSRLFLGILLGLLFEYSGRLWLSFAAHFFNNAIVITFMYWQAQQGRSLTAAMQEGSGSWVGILALPVVIALLILFKKIAPKPIEVPDGVIRNEELRNTPFY